MKIYEIGTGYTPIPAQMGAATEIVVEELVKAFQTQGVDVTLLDIRSDNRKINHLPIQGVSVPGCFAATDVQLGLLHKLKRVAYSLALAGKLRGILRRAEEPVVLHFHNQYNLFFFLKLVSPKLRAKAKTVYTVHSYIWAGAWEEIQKTVRKRYFQEVCCVRNADRVLVLNDRTADHFIRRLGVPEARIRRVRNGVNMDAYRPIAEDCKAGIGLPGQKIIFQVGSVCRRKNQLGAVTALKTYLQTHPDVIYLYAGGIVEGDYQDKIRVFAEENGISKQVRYAGELCPGDELNRYYNAADVTVFPSRQESFGMVILESLSAGTPVILTGEPMFPVDRGVSVCRSNEDFVRAVDACLNQEGDSQLIRSGALDYSWAQVAREHLAIFAEMEENPWQKS